MNFLAVQKLSTRISWLSLITITCLSLQIDTQQPLINLTTLCNTQQLSSIRKTVPPFQLTNEDIITTLQNVAVITTRSVITTVKKYLGYIPIFGQLSTDVINIFELSVLKIVNGIAGFLSTNLVRFIRLFLNINVSILQVVVVELCKVQPTLQELLLLMESLDDRLAEHFNAPSK